MTSTENCSNQKSFSQSVFKDKVYGIPYKLNNIPSSLRQTNWASRPMSNFIFNSNFSNKNLPFRERLNSFNSFNNEKEDDLYKKPFMYIHNSNLEPSFFHITLDGSNLYKNYNQRIINDKFTRINVLPHPYIFYNVNSAIF